MYLPNRSINCSTIYRSTRTYMISAFSFLPDFDDSIVSGADIDFGTNINANGYLQYDDPGALTRRAVCGLPVRDGERITSVILCIREDAAEEVAARLYKIAYTTGVRTQVGSTATSNNGTGDELLLVFAGTEDVDSGSFYWIEIDATPTASSLRIYGAIIQVSVPAP